MLQHHAKQMLCILSQTIDHQLNSPGNFHNLLKQCYQLEPSIQIHGPMRTFHIRTTMYFTLNILFKSPLLKFIHSSLTPKFFSLIWNKQYLKEIMFQKHIEYHSLLNENAVITMMFSQDSLYNGDCTWYQPLVKLEIRVYFQLLYILKLCWSSL